MINISITNFDKRKFEQDFKREFEREAILNVKDEVRKKVTPDEFKQLKFTFDWKESTVTVNGPDEITKKFE